MRSIEEWLASLGLAEYASRFAEHRIDFSILGDLTDRDLKDELGIVVLGDRRRCSGRLPNLPNPPPPSHSYRVLPRQAHETKPSAAKSR
jgi:SAM (Sterile alpha motif) domain-containing protein